MIQQSQDWLMRQIEIMIKALAKLIFNKETANFVIIDYIAQKDSEFIYDRLLNLIGEGKINEAENLLFEKMHEEAGEIPAGKKYLVMAIAFYSRLNDLDDKTLNGCDFDRSEIYDGLKEAAAIYGVDLI